MKHQNKARPILNATAAMDRGLSIVTFAAFQWLAITTAIMAYNACKPLAERLLPDWASTYGLGISVALIFILIDYRLSSDILDYWKSKNQVAKGMEVADAKSAKWMFYLIGFLLIVRCAITLSSSLWSAEIIASATTPAPNYENYAAQISGHSNRLARMDSIAKGELITATDDEAAKIETATAKGDQLIARAINSGNPSQRAMWRKNSGFFYPPPQGKYYKGNVNYVRRIDKAVADKKALIAAAKGGALAAKNHLATIRQSATTDSTATMLNSLAIMERDEQTATHQMKAKFLYYIDFIAFFLGCFALRIRHQRNKAAGWLEDPTRRNLASIISQARDRVYDYLLKELEEILGIDIDGDGHVGEPATGSGNNRQVQKPFFQSSATTPPDEDKQSRDDGYFFSKHPNPTLPPNDGPKMPFNGVATSSYGVATKVEPPPPVARNVSPDRLLGHYRNTMSTLKSYESRTNLTTGNATIADLKTTLNGICRDLAKMGLQIKKVDGKTGPYYIAPLN